MKYAQYILFLVIVVTPFISFSQEKIDLLILNRNYTKAIELIDNQLDKNPSAELFFKKGTIYNQLQNYQEALKMFAKANELESNNPDVLGELAEGFATIGNYHDAVPYFEKAVKLRSEDFSLAGKAGRNFINLKNYKKAYAVFENIYLNDSTNIYWNKQFAFCSFQMNKNDQAIQLYEKVLEANPRDYSSYFNLIRLYRMKNQHENILNTIDRGLVYFPGEADFYEERANFFFTNKQYTFARTAFENYFAAGGDSIYKNLMNFGITLYFERDEKKSIPLFDICASQVANDPIVLFYLSLNYKRLAEYEVSEAFMNAAIESATPFYLPEMYHHLGQIHGQQREFEESILALKKANELDPTNNEVLFEIATTYEEYNSNKTLALNYYQIYLKQAGAEAKNMQYAQDRINRIKEDMFFEE